VPTDRSQRRRYLLAKRPPVTPLSSFLKIGHCLSVSILLSRQGVHRFFHGVFAVFEHTLCPDHLPVMLFMLFMFIMLRRALMFIMLR
jgi:hypothetical protein